MYENLSSLIALGAWAHQIDKLLSATASDTDFVGSASMTTSCAADLKPVRAEVEPGEDLGADLERDTATDRRVTDAQETRERQIPGSDAHIPGDVGTIEAVKGCEGSVGCDGQVPVHMSEQCT